MMGEPILVLKKNHLRPTILWLKPPYLIQTTNNKWKSLPQVSPQKKPFEDLLVVSTPLKNISQNGNLPQIGVKIKNL